MTSPRDRDGARAPGTSGRRTSGRRTPGQRTAGTLAGAPLHVTPWGAVTLVVTAALALRLLADRVLAPSPVLVVAAVVVAALVLGSVVAHELAHALAARRLGVGVDRVTLTAWGARVALDERALRPGSTAVVAAAGPAVSLALAAAAWGGAALVPDGGLVWWSLAAVAAVNAATGGMNLLPAAPLDGGKLLAAGVWAVTGDRARGTVVAAWGGRVLAVLVLLVLVVRPLLRGGRVDLVVVVLAVLGAVLLWGAADAALRGARSARRVEALDLRRLAAPAVALPQDDTVADLAALAGLGGLDAGAVVLVDGAWRPVAWADAAAVAHVPVERRPATPLRDVAQPLPPECVVDARLPGADAVRAVATGAAASPVLVLVDGAEVLGLLHARDVVAALRG